MKKHTDRLKNILWLTFLIITFLGCEVFIGVCKDWASTNGLLKSDITIITLRILECISAIIIIIEVIELTTGIQIKKYFRQFGEKYLQIKTK